MYLFFSNYNQYSSIVSKKFIWIILGCFPPSYNIFEKFTHWYHLAISNEIQRLITTGLESQSIIEVLIFINSYMSENFMGNPSLGLNKDKLPELLDADQQNVLLKRYYETTKASLRNCYKNVAVIILEFF